MQMSPRNAFGVRYVFDGRSHDRLAQGSSGLRMLLGPSPPGNIRRSIAPSVVGTPAPHAAAPYRASGFVRWREADIRRTPRSAKCHVRKSVDHVVELILLRQVSWLCAQKASADSRHRPAIMAPIVI